MVEFLRANAFIKRTFKEIDYSKYTHKENGYYHLELSTKIEFIKMLTCFEQISVCEDCTEAYEYWKKMSIIIRTIVAIYLFHPKKQKVFRLNILEIWI